MTGTDGRGPEEPLRRLRDDDRWADRAFVLRPAQIGRRAAPARTAGRAAGIVLVTAAAVAAVVVLLPAGGRPGSNRALETGPTASTRPIAPRAPRVAGGGLHDAPVAPVPWSSLPGDGVDLARASGRDAAEPGVGVAVRLPSRVPAGDRLDYAVVVTNTASSALHLDPCPQIAQQVRAAGRSTTRVTTLRCDGAAGIPPGSAVSFVMRARLPAAASGPVTVRWRLAGGPAASATTEVEEP